VIQSRALGAGSGSRRPWAKGISAALTSHIRVAEFSQAQLSAPERGPERRQPASEAEAEAWDMRTSTAVGRNRPVVISGSEKRGQIALLRGVITVQLVKTGLNP